MGVEEWWDVSWPHDLGMSKCGPTRLQCNQGTLCKHGVLHLLHGQGEQA